MAAAAIGMLHLIGKPLRFGSAAGVAQKVEYVHQAGPRDDALATHVPVAAGEVAKQIDLQLVAGCEVGMATFGGEDVVLRPVPIHAGLPESGAGGDYRLVAYGISFYLVQRNYVFGVKRRNSPGVGLKIINQNCLFQFEFVGETSGLDDPGKIGCFNPAVANRASNAEASGIGMHLCRIDELRDDLIQAGIFAARKHGCGNQAEVAVDNIEERQPCIGPSDVACQDHLSKFLQWRPSRSSNSSASFGPHVPAA